MGRNITDGGRGGREATRTTPELRAQRRTRRVGSAAQFSTRAAACSRVFICPNAHESGSVTLFPMNAPPANHHARGVALMIGSTFCFTANVLLVRALGDIESVNVWLVSCVRFIVGVGVVVALYRTELQLPRLFRNSKLAARGLVGGAGVYGFYLTVVELGAGRATFINNTYVIFGAVMAVWMLGEHFSRVLAIGSVAALGGLALLTNVFGGNSHANVYDLLAIITALASAYVVVTIRQLHATEHTSTIFAAQCVYGLILCAIPAALHLQVVSGLGWGIMSVAGIFAGLGQIAMTRAFRDLSVAEGSLLQMLVPLGIAVGGAVIFRERFAVHEIVGAGNRVYSAPAGIAASEFAAN
jgi:drug/metabolite transporter (DMT)-like permease